MIDFLNFLLEKPELNEWNELIQNLVIIAFILLFITVLIVIICKIMRKLRDKISEFDEEDNDRTEDILEYDCNNAHKMNGTLPQEYMQTNITSTSGQFLSFKI
jgi:flagellar biosynthesis/type III secretory pathway M-ring protein FliF/YscJ